jgi:dolichol-phosphate mannosyltransferase
MDKLRVTVVIPAYNEEKNIKRVIDEVRPLCDDVLVVLSKKSNDKTADIVKGCGVKYVVDNGKGKGDAIRLAIGNITEGVIVFFDADGSHDPQDIPRLAKPIQDDAADLVMGSRMTGGSDELHGKLDEFLRLMFSNMITLIINYRFKVCYTDYQNGLRAIRATTAKKLKLEENITTIEQEIAIKCLKAGCRITEIPTHEYFGGPSSFNVWKVGPRYFWSLVKNMISRK